MAESDEIATPGRNPRPPRVSKSWWQADSSTPGILAASRDRAIKLGVGAERIDELVARLRAARDGGYAWASSPFHRDLTLGKPT
jgi:hypothetical protein